MLSTSLDILNLILAVCILVLTFFLCWAMFYFIKSVQRINRVTKMIEGGIIKIDEILDIAKDKLKNSSAYFMILSEVAKKAMEFVQEKRSSFKEARKNKANKNTRKK